MRVIAGSARGVRLSAPKGLTTRPTADRVKEALFSILDSRFSIEGARVLDICAGTGSLGIEALSRGAAACSFIERDRSVMAFLEKNLAISSTAQRAECLTLDVMAALQLLARNQKRYDIVFLDPPYRSSLYSVVPAALCSLLLLAEDAVLVAECSSRFCLEERFGRLVRFDRRVYGDTALEFYTGEYL